MVVERKMVMSCLVERKENGYEEKQRLVGGLEMRVMKHFTCALYSQEPNPIQLRRYYERKKNKPLYMTSRAQSFLPNTLKFTFHRYTDTFNTISK